MPVAQPARPPCRGAPDAALPEGERRRGRARLRSRRSARPSRKPDCCSATRVRGRQGSGRRWRAFAQHKVLPDLRNIHFIGRAITPPGRPRRFDARFFTMDASAIAHRVEGVTGPDAELVELVWMPLAEAKELDMPAVTGVMLEELDARIADGFGHDLPVPFYRMIRGSFVREML